MQLRGETALLQGYWVRGRKTLHSDVTPGGGPADATGSEGALMGGLAK
jgi:hypothetical protein